MQALYFISESDYNANKTASNLTIQHTVADIVPSVVPERVTDIIVEEEEEEEEGRTSAMALAKSKSIVLRYQLTAYDPNLTLDMLRGQLVRAASDGQMDARLRYNAARFGAIGLLNGTFGEPQVTSTTTQDASATQYSDLEIALIATGAVLFVVLLLVGMLHLWRRKQVYTVRVACADREEP